MSQGLFTAVTGIRANQTRLTVIANNLANVNTTAFKSSSVNFKTIFAGTISSGTRPTNNSGGTNPRQIGNGVTLSDIPVNFSQGGSQFTGRKTDMRISGEGFFTVEKQDRNGNIGFSLTRAGNFTIDAEGNLASANGNRVLGTAVVTGTDPTLEGTIKIPTKLTIWKEVDSATNTVVATYVGTEASVNVPALTTGDTMREDDVELVDYSFGADGSITAIYSNNDKISVINEANGAGPNRQLYHQTAEGDDFSIDGTGVSGGTFTVQDAGAVDPWQLQLKLATVVNPEGLISEGNNGWAIGPDSGDASFGIGNQGSRGAIEQGALESSNVDIAKEFTDMIASQRGLEAASKVVTAQSDVLRTIIGIV